MVSAGAKMLNVVANEQTLSRFSSLFPFLTVLQISTLAGVLEFSVAVVLMFNSKTSRSQELGLIAWLGTLFLIYRLGNEGECGCFGNLSGQSSENPQFSFIVTPILLAYLLIGSYGLLWLRWRRNGGVRRNYTKSRNA